MGKSTRQHRHDRGYRRLFSKPRLIEELLRGFFDPSWVQRLDFTTLEQVPSSFVTPGLRARESDVIWMLRTRQGRPVYVFLLLELQSTVERTMAVRMMAYVALLYLDLIAKGKLTPEGKLPLIVPIVLYNGDASWTAPQDVADLIESFAPEIDELRPHMKYRLIDEGSYDVGELEGRENLAALLFWLEKTPEPEDLQRGVQRLGEWLSGPEDGELRSAFAAWLRLVRLPGEGLTEDDIPAVLGLEEFTTMLAKRVEEWNKILLERGEQKGLQKGQRELLLRLLEVKFGEVDARTRSRVRAAGPERLLEWGERLVTASQLSEVFAAR
jgi:predicted transposase/invertase (TIGR01784 family)